MASLDRRTEKGSPSRNGSLRKQVEDMTIKILAMAFHRKDALRYIRKMRYRIADNIALILLYPNDINVNHWFNELLGPVKGVRNHRIVKRGGGNITREEYKELLYGEPLDSQDQLEILFNEAVGHMEGKEPTGTLNKLETIYERLIDLCMSNVHIDTNLLKRIIK